MSHYDNERRYIIRHYAPAVPETLKRGTRVYSPHYKRYGRVTGFQLGFARLYVRLDGDKRSGVYHPTSVTYNPPEEKAIAS